MGLFKRLETLERLRAKVSQRKPIIGGGAGTGISAKMWDGQGLCIGATKQQSFIVQRGGRGAITI